MVQEIRKAKTMFQDLKKLKQILTRQEQLKFTALLGAIIVMAFMQALGVASVMPFIGLVMKPSMVFENRWLSLAYDLLGFDSVRSFTVFAGIAMFTIIVLANAVSAFTIWIKTRITLMSSHRLSKRLLQKYLAMPYAFFLNQNSSELSKNVLSEVDHLTSRYLLPLLDIITKSLLVFFLLLVLFWVNVYVSLIVLFVIGGIYTLIYWRINHKLKYFGQKRWAANKIRYKSTYEAFSGIKEIKVMNRENYFLHCYSSASLRHARYNSWSEVISKLPKFALEAIAFGGIIVYSLILLLIQEDARQVIPMAGLFAFAGYRLMPSLQEIFSSFTKMQFNKAVLDRIYQDITGEEKGAFGFMVPQKNIPEPLPFHQEIKLENISYNYPNTCWPAVKEINLTIQNGEKVAFVGPTGAGKTTMVDIILGLLNPHQGKLLVDGVTVERSNLSNWQINIGYVPQHIFLGDDKVIRNIAFGLPDKEIDRKAVEHAAKVANIHEFIIDELPNGYDTWIGEDGIRLSGGQRQRIGIARALYHNPNILVFDEATSALDGVTEEAVLQAMENAAKLKTLIVIAHRLTTVKNCDMVYIIDKGKITGQGTYEELLGSNKQFQAMAKVKM
jgi:ATP-binding cassette, subfamily B, bacterial PglK